MSLTIKQEKFAQGLFIGLTQREAYKQSFSATNMKDKTIDERACILANQDKIRTRCKELTDELKERNMVTVDKILAEYSKIGFSDIKDFLEFKTDKCIAEYDEKGKAIVDYKQIVDVKPSSEVDGTLINEISIGKDGTLKFKLHDKMAALEKMGKHLGMFIDKVEVKATINKKLEDYIE